MRLQIFSESNLRERGKADNAWAITSLQCDRQKQLITSREVSGEQKRIVGQKLQEIVREIKKKTKRQDQEGEKKKGRNYG